MDLNMTERMNQQTNEQIQLYLCMFSCDSNQMRGLAMEVGSISLVSLEGHPSKCTTPWKDGPVPHYTKNLRGGILQGAK